MVQFHLFACEYSVYPTPLVKETALSPLYILGTLNETELYRASKNNSK